MLLGHMIAVDEDALTCDLMETYHLSDWQSMDADFVATLAIGLRDDSRIKRKMSGSKLTIDQSLLALLLDALRINNWMHTKDAQHRRNIPESIYKRLTTEEKEKKVDELRHFDSVEDFEEWHRKHMRK